MRENYSTSALCNERMTYKFLKGLQTGYIVYRVTICSLTEMTTENFVQLSKSIRTYSNLQQVAIVNKTAFKGSVLVLGV